MSIFRCKMCGGDLEITEGQSVCTCEFCGTEQTLPRLDSDRKTNLYDRANHFRRNNDFDKAMGIYEQILNEDNTDSEAYWSLVLCRYGIEYVEDPATHRRIPTVNRAQYTSIYADENYKSALEYASSDQKIVYEQEAKAIDEIQKGILAISEKEEPFDVFICYKETDENGRRTPDSVLANDLYHQLTLEGFKVFFSRITLEDKLGQEYEPYIFAALNSAKVMVVLGTKPDYFNAVWVKNEWSRYLTLIREGAKKMLIPAYKDMDPYDLPEEFSHLQAQDMAKLGFMQDLIRAVKKIIGSDQTPAVTSETVVVQQNTGAGNPNALIKRGNMALEDGEWKRADEFFEEVLNQDAECAEAYLGKLMAKCQKSNVASLAEFYKGKYTGSQTEKIEACKEDSDRIQKAVERYTVLGYLNESEIRPLYDFDRCYDSELSFRKRQKEQMLSELSDEKLLVRAQKYAAGESLNTIENMLADITTAYDGRIENAQKADKADVESTKNAYAKHLDDADAKAEELYKDAIAERESKYMSVVEKMKAADSILYFQDAKDEFEQMNGYKDSQELAAQCQKEIDRLKEEQRLESERLEEARIKEAKRIARKRKKIAIAAGSVLAAGIAVFMLVTKIVIPNYKYNSAIEAKESGDYKTAVEKFVELGDFKDSTEQITDSKYLQANELMKLKDYAGAVQKFAEVEGYKDTEKLKRQAEFYIISDAKVNDRVWFGNYEGNTEWIVIDKKDKKLLLLSKDALEYRPYNTKDAYCEWKDCTLRKWLNSKYISMTFNTDERKMILKTKLKNNSNRVSRKNNSYKRNKGKQTIDQLFLLSAGEVNTYLKSSDIRQASMDNKIVRWWIRSLSTVGKNSIRYYNSDCMIVGGSGEIIEYGLSVIDDKCAVRPAMWVDASKAGY